MISHHISAEFIAQACLDLMQAGHISRNGVAEGSRLQNSQVVNNVDKSLRCAHSCTRGLRMQTAAKCAYMGAVFFVNKFTVDLNKISELYDNKHKEVALTGGSPLMQSTHWIIYI